MDLFHLYASLALDTSEYDKSITGAKKTIGAFGEYVKKVLQEVWDFGVDSVKTGMGFDKQMGIVASYLGKAEATEEHMADLRRAALDEARNSVFTGEEVGTAYEYMAVAGWKYAELLAGLPALIDAAAASDENFASVADIVTDAMTAFGEDADQTQRFVDVMASTTANSNTNFLKLGQSFKYVAPIAHDVGMSFEEASLFLGIMADNGIKASQAGTALRNILTRISTNPGASTFMMGEVEVHINGAREMIEELGVEVYDTAGNFRPWIDIITELREAWKDMSGEVRSSFAKDLGNAWELDYTFGDTRTAVQLLEDTLADLGEEYASLTQDKIPQFWIDNAEIFKRYDIEIKDIYGDYKDFETVAEEARAAIGGLSDEEKMLIANRVASLRAMPAFLALLETDDDKFNQLWEAILNSEGAAEEMAQTRLDNLWGDFQMLYAAFDTLKISIYDDVKSPLREIVQWATGALTRIEDAIREGGIQGGLEQLANELTNAIAIVQPIFEALGKALVPILETVLTDVMPAVINLALAVGAAFANGLIDGIMSRIKGNSIIGKLLTEGFTYTPPTGTTPDTDTLNAMLGNGMLTGGAPKVGAFDIDIDGSGFVAEGEEASEFFAAGFDGAGTEIGEDVADEIQGALDATGFSIDISHIKLGGWAGLLPGLIKTDDNAVAMSGGRILNHATIFGFNGKGQPLLGGETGQEAIIGTGSLQRIIKDAVSDSVKKYVPSVQPQQNVVLQMDGKTVARVQREHNASESTARLKAIALGYGR